MCGEEKYGSSLRIIPRRTHRGEPGNKAKPALHDACGVTPSDKCLVN